MVPNHAAYHRQLIKARTDEMKRSFSKDKGFFFLLKSQPISFLGGASVNLSKQQMIVNNPF